MDELIARVLHRCVFLQIAVREGLPAHAVLTQVQHLDKLLTELIPLLEEQDAADLDREIKMQALHPVHEEALADLLGVNNDADTDQDEPTYPPKKWR